MQSATLALTNGTPVIVAIVGAPVGSQFVTVTPAVTPVSGTMTVEFTRTGDPTFYPLRKATARSLTAGPVTLRLEGPVSSLRVTFAGLPGGAGNALLWIVAQPAPLALYEGLAAMTVQPYTEANVKNGLQYYARASWPTSDEIAAGTTRKLWLQVGAKPVIVKLRDLHFVAEELTLRLYAGPTGVTGGTDLTIHNYNSINPVATTVQAKKNVTTATDGTEFDGGDPEYFFGSSALGQRAANSIPQGRERIIAPGGQFIVAITNTSAGTARVQYFLDWYEGEPDLPL